MEPFFEDFEGDDPVSFVFSLNLHRRHLSESQRAMVAAKAKPLYEAEAKTRQGVRTDIQENLPECSKGQARDKAAAAVNVSGRSVSYAETVLHKGTPALVEAVEQGRLAVSAAAEVARMTPERQREVLERADLSKSGNVRAPLSLELAIAGKAKAWSGWGGL